MLSGWRGSLVFFRLRRVAMREILLLALVWVMLFDNAFLSEGFSVLVREGLMGSVLVW